MVTLLLLACGSVPAPEPAATPAAAPERAEEPALSPSAARTRSAPGAAPGTPDRPDAPEAPDDERDLAFAGEGRWDLGGARVILAGTTLTVDGAAAIDEVYDEPVAGEGVLYVPCDRPDRAGQIVALRVEGGAPVLSPVVQGGRPDRLALAPDGGTLAFVSGASGFASLWTVAVCADCSAAEAEEQAADAVQRTNVGLVRTPGRAPEGWVPPPREAPRVSDRGVTWDGPRGPVEVTWR